MTSNQTKDLDTLLSGEESVFAAAAKSVISGDVESLRRQLSEHPNLAQARSRAEHRSTLLHCVAANGIEDELQLSGESIYQVLQKCSNEEHAKLRDRPVAIVKELISAGAEVDAVCGTYGGGNIQTTLNLLVSSAHPANAKVQSDLVRALHAAGAKINGVDDDGSPLGTALAFGYPEAVTALVDCGARTDNIVFAAAAGRLSQVQSYFDDNGQLKSDVGQCSFAWFRVAENTQTAAEEALVFASLCNQVDVVEYLLDRGIDINAEPPGSHVTATALHAAALKGNEATVQLLIERGADPTIKDRQHQSIAYGWAEFAGEETVAAMLKKYTIEFMGKQ